VEPLPTPTDDDLDFYHWYGPWEPFRPPEVAELFAGVDAPWWIVGGWAIEAFTGVAREHEDIDVAFFRADLPKVLAHLSPALCIWSNLMGTIRPVRKPEDVIEGSRQMWVRRDGVSPWVMDLRMTPHDGATWIAPRDERIRMPLEAATFVADDGIRYLQPELALFMKALGARPKDERDVSVVLRTLAPDRRAWLVETIELVHPGHRWLTGLLAPPPE
jgi:hypothetical protein